MRSVILFIALIAVASAWRVQNWFGLATTFSNATSCPTTTPTFDVIGASGACFSSTGNADALACIGAAGAAGSSVKITDVAAAPGNGCLNNATCVKFDLYTNNDCTGTQSGPTYVPLNICGCNACPAQPTAKATCAIWTASASTIASGVAVIALLVAALL